MARLGAMYDVLDAAERADALRRQRDRRTRRENPENCPFYMLSDVEFFQTYRLTKSVASDLVHELDPLLPRVRSSSISVVSKVLSALAFYAHGSYQRGVGQCLQHNMAQQTVSKCLDEVTAALNSDYMREKYIRFPQSADERNTVKRGFYDKFGVPGVLGCVDGTHIAIIRPVLNEERYINRKGYHSLNAQIVCDSDLKILSIDASHGGSNHDSFIWEQHPLRDHMEQLQETEATWLLGDSGYAQRRWMMTPVLDAALGSPCECYNEYQKSTRNVVERTIGVLKARWRCLLVHRVLHYTPEMAGAITNACVVLHNIATMARLEVPDLTEEERRAEQERQMNEVLQNDGYDRQGRSTRNRLLDEGRIARERLTQRLWQQRNQ